LSGGKEMMSDPVKIEEITNKKIKETKELEELLDWFLREKQKR